MSSSPTQHAALTPSWWAGGLALSERLTADRPPPDAALLERADRRLHRWRCAHDLGVTGMFAARLADLALDEGGLTALLAEPVPALAARTARPAWAEFVQHAVEAPAHQPASPAEASLDAFAQPLRVFTDTAKALLHSAATDHVDLPTVADGFAGHLARRLVQLAARTLVLELNVARVAGRLRGATGTERFTDFLRQLGTGYGLAAVLEEYPVLARLLGQTCQHAAEAQIELLERFAADRPAIVATLLGGTDPGLLTEVELGLGDPHGRGRSVAVLRFAAGAAVVYKPRPQAMQRHFGEFVDWLNAKVDGLKLRAPATLSRPGYGWVEFIAHRPCASVTEVDRFYRRQGALLALLYAVDGTDIHYGNLIAAGDQPVLVDVETLFHPTVVPPATAGPDPAQLALSTSVTRTALLPHLLVGEHGGLDISGLGGDKGGRFPFDAVSWDAAGTDEMRLTRTTAEFHGAVNRPRLGGADVDPAEHRAALLAGFRAGYHAIVAHRTDFLRLLQSCADADIRLVARHTRVYTTLLDESTHPDVLRDGLDRDRLFDLLWSGAAHDPLLRRLVRHELAELWAGDVPLFVTRPRSRDLWTAGGERIPDVFATSSLDAVTAKVLSMDEVGRVDQEWLIEATMATRVATAGHGGGRCHRTPVAATVLDPPRLLTAACGIADQIVARSLHDEHRANWLGLECLGGRNWAVIPMGAGLAEGYVGVALFLAQLGRLTGTRRYVDLARKALRPIPRLIETFGAEPELARAVGPGGFVGIGGICYALARLATLLEDGELLRWLAAAVEVAGTAVDGSADIAAGQAGGLLAMRAVHAETGMESAIRVARVFADRLVENPEKPPELAGETFLSTGFAGGMAGVAYAIRQFAAANPEGRYTEAAQALTDSTEILDPVALENAGYGWCAGASGMLLANSDVAAPAVVERWVPVLAGRQPLLDTSLCHGELGAMEALTVLSERGFEVAAKARTQCAARALAALDRCGPRCGTPDGVPSPGLLTGLAGIGYGLLRLGFAEQVPSVLMLEPKNF